MTTYYVSPTGNDKNPGTEPLPFRNIQEAAYVVKPGDTVIVKDGIYTDTHSYGVILQIWKGGTQLQPITFRSEHKWGAVLDGLNNQTSSGIIVVPDQSYITIDGFEIKNLYEYGILTYPTTSHITMKNNSIHNIGNFVYSGTCASAPPGKIGNGILPSGKYHIVDSNLIYEIGKTGVTTCYHNWDHAIYSTTSADGMQFINNIVWDIWTGIAVESASNNQIFSNNIIARLTDIPRADDPDTYLFDMSMGSNDNVIVQNNIFLNCVDNDAVIWVYNPQEGSQVRNNIKYNCTNWDEGSWTGLTYSYNIDANPLFINLAKRDFHLQSNSPAIGKGTTDKAPLYDFDGNPRTGHNDIGAFQYIGTTQCPDLLTEFKITKI